MITTACNCACNTHVCLPFAVQGECFWHFFVLFFICGFDTLQIVVSGVVFLFKYRSVTTHCLVAESVVCFFLFNS